MRLLKLRTVVAILWFFAVIPTGAQNATFVTIMPMNTSRSGHTATLLSSGLVLVSGGESSSLNVLGTAELYDPITGNWRFTAFPMNRARSGHTATLLQDGRVLIAGGFDSTGNLNDVEFFDPVNEAFVVGPSLSEARRTHSALALRDGRVLVVAGHNGSFTCFPCLSQVVEIFDSNQGPPGTGAWTLADPLPAPRTFLATTLLANGQVLAVGGQEPTQPGSSSVFLYDPLLNAWQTMASLLQPRQAHSVTTLPDGKTLVVGGVSTFAFSPTDTVEVYDTLGGASGESVFGDPIPGARGGHRALSLPGGDVLVVGGQNSGGFVLEAQLYVFASGKWSPAGSLNVGRAGHSAVRLNSGLVLIAGGVSETQTGNTAVNFAELWHPASIGLLIFPLRNKTAFTARINTVFDHSMDQQYCPDGVVTAYNGEEGRRKFGQSKFFVHFKCDGVRRKQHGFMNEVGTEFSLGGQYAGGGEPIFLFYDGHPGYDFRTKDQFRDGTLCPAGRLCNKTGKTEVVAAAPGVVRVACPKRNCPEGPGEVKIEHAGGYFTIYLHLSRITVTEDQEVGAGQVIGVSGDQGAEGNPHLHFEVRKDIGGGVIVPVDPYGWGGTGLDPYTRAVNIKLWK